jgi:hypothetical protein
MSLVLTWTDLIPGSCAVSEADATGGLRAWITVVSGSPAMVRASGGQATARVSNTHKPQVLPATVTPPATRTQRGGTAFTGTAAGVPLEGLVLALLLVGTGLLWLGRRREGEQQG